VQLNGGGEGHSDAVGVSDLCEVSVGTTVDIGDGDDVRPAGERLQDIGGSSRARGIGKGVLGMLESSYGSLEIIPVKVSSRIGRWSCG
jgi:hypothetical protein